MGARGELHVTSMKATRIDFDKVVDTNIENETFCDALCLGNAIMEMAWIRDQEVGKLPAPIEPRNSI